MKLLKKRKQKRLASINSHSKNHNNRKYMTIKIIYQRNHMLISKQANKSKCNKTRRHLHQLSNNSIFNHNYSNSKQLVSAPKQNLGALQQLGKLNQQKKQKTKFQQADFAGNAIIIKESGDTGGGNEDNAHNYEQTPQMEKPSPKVILTF